MNVCNFDSSQTYHFCALDFDLLLQFWTMMDDGSGQWRHSQFVLSLHDRQLSLICLWCQGCNSWGDCIADGSCGVSVSRRQLVSVPMASICAYLLSNAFASERALASGFADSMSLFFNLSLSLSLQLQISWNCCLVHSNGNSLTAKLWQKITGTQCLKVLTVSEDIAWTMVLEKRGIGNWIVQGDEEKP